MGRRRWKSVGKPHLRQARRIGENMGNRSAQTIRIVISTARAAAAAGRIVRELIDPVRDAVSSALDDDGAIDLDEAAEIGRLAAVQALGELNERRAAADRILILERYSPEAREAAAGHAGALIGALAIGRS